MEKSCANCKYFEPVKRRGQKYPKGACKQHYNYRVSDGYQSRLFVSTPDEFVCDLHEHAPQQAYAIVDNEPVLIPAVMVEDLKKQGWVLVKLDSNGMIVSKQDEA